MRHVFSVNQNKDHRAFKSRSNLGHTQAEEILPSSRSEGQSTVYRSRIAAATEAPVQNLLLKRAGRMAKFLYSIPVILYDKYADFFSCALR